MANPEHVAHFKHGAEFWNSWRQENPNVVPDLSDVDFEGEFHDYQHQYDMPEFGGFDLSGANLNRIQARNSIFTRCRFNGCKLYRADLCFSYFQECDFSDAAIRVARIGSAGFQECIFERTDLSYCSAVETEFTGSRFIDARLDYMRMVQTDLSDTKIFGTRVYGLSAWDLKTDGSEQKNILISETGDLPAVDDIEIAHFIHILTNAPKIRDAIDTLTSTAVLILGRFSDDRSAVLEEFRQRLRQGGYIPIIFDFDKPKSRDLTETISILANLSRFVVADLTSPRSSPHELATVVPHLRSVPVQPVILKGDRPYGMFKDFSRYPWVMEVLEYQPTTLDVTTSMIVRTCESYLADGSD